MTDSARPDDVVFADERRDRIAQLVAVRGRMRIAELAAQFGVTQQTVRKDLRELQEQGLLKRTHGGAIALRPIPPRALELRSAAQREAKAAIGAACLELLSEGDSIFLDSGTTVATISRALGAAQRSDPSRFRSLSLLTSVLDIAREAAEMPGVGHILLGGQVRPASGSVIGALTEQTLQQFTISVAFIGVSGFAEEGITVGNVPEAAFKTAVIERSRRVVVPMDHTKIGAIDFARISSLDEIDTLVLDRAPTEISELCEAHDIELIVAESADGRR